MEIKIEVSAKPADMTQAEYHRIKRVSNVLIEAGHEVRIIWAGSPTKGENELQSYHRETVTNY